MGPGRGGGGQSAHWWCPRVQHRPPERSAALWQSWPALRSSLGTQLVAAASRTWPSPPPPAPLASETLAQPAVWRAPRLEPAAGRCGHSHNISMCSHAPKALLNAEYICKSVHSSQLVGRVCKMATARTRLTSRSSKSRPNGLSVLPASLCNINYLHHTRPWQGSVGRLLVCFSRILGRVGTGCT